MKEILLIYQANLLILFVLEIISTLVMWYSAFYTCIETLVFKSAIFWTCLILTLIRVNFVEIQNVEIQNDYFHCQHLIIILKYQYKLVLDKYR